MTLYTITEIGVYDALDLLEKQTEGYVCKRPSTEFHHGDQSIVRHESEENDEFASAIAYWRHWEDEE